MMHESMEALPHRREHARLRLGIGAIFIGLDGAQAVVLQDLSQTGAKLLLEHAQPISRGFLRWLDYEVFAEVAWRRGRWCGVQFDALLSKDCLFATRAAAPAAAKASKILLLQHAEEFAQGTGGSFFKD